MWTVLLVACQGGDSSEPQDTEAEELRRFFQGEGPVPAAAGRDQHRHTLARLAVRGSGIRSSGVAAPPDEAWFPVAERSGTDLMPGDVRAWQESGDIDATGSFVPLRPACQRKAPGLDSLSGEIGKAGLDTRAARVLCAVDRLAGGEVSLSWSRGSSYAVVVDRQQHTAMVNPRLVALVEPDAAESGAPAAGGVAIPGSGNGPSNGASAGDSPGVAPLDYDENGHHPPPPKTSTNGDSSRTWCDKACDDVWNNVFPSCSCNGAPGSGAGGGGAGGAGGGGTAGSSGSNGCDCGKTAGSNSSGCGSSACKCAIVSRSAQDTTGLGVTALLAGTLLLRRRKKPWLSGHGVVSSTLLLLRRKRERARSPGDVFSILPHLRRRREQARGPADVSAALPAGRRQQARSRGRSLLSFLAVLLVLAWAVRALAAPGARPKLVDVKVVVTPGEAAVFVDGNAVSPESGIVRVPAGSHTFSAKLDGYADAVEEIAVPEKGTGTLVTLRLAANKGYLVLTGSDPAAVLSIDGAVVGKGSFSGLVAPGSHVVTTAPQGQPPRSYSVNAVIGQSVTVSLDGPPTYFPPPPPPPQKPPPPPEKPRKPAAPAPSGPYFLIGATLVWQTSRPYDFEHTSFPSPGFAVGGRAGYRFGNNVGLEALVEYGRIANGGVVLQTYDIDQNGDGKVTGGEAATDRSPGAYVLESIRFGPVLRLTTSGPVNRFVGGIGLGVLHEMIALDHADLLWDSGTMQYRSIGTYHHHYEGWSPYLLLEGGYERSIGAFLAGFIVQLTVESVSGIEGQPYNSGLQARAGLGLRAGWAAW